MMESSKDLSIKEVGLNLSCMIPQEETLNLNFTKILLSLNNKKNLMMKKLKMTLVKLKSLLLHHFSSLLEIKEFLLYHQEEMT